MACVPEFSEDFASAFCFVLIAIATVLWQTIAYPFPRHVQKAFWRFYVTVRILIHQCKPNNGWKEHQHFVGLYVFTIYSADHIRQRRSHQTRADYEIGLLNQFLNVLFSSTMTFPFFPAFLQFTTYRLDIMLFISALKVYDDSFQILLHITTSLLNGV